MAQQQNPKVSINQFYQRAKAALPIYNVAPAPVDGQENRFICTLTLPAVTVEGETLPEQIFQEEGPSKKAAQDAAAATAFRFLAEQPVYSSAKPYEESLLRTLATRVLSPQGLFRDPEVHGAAATAMAYLDGYLPLAILPHSRILRGWAKEYGVSIDPNLASDPMALVDLVRRELAAQAAAAVPPEAAEAEESKADGAVAALSLGPNGLCLQLTPKAAEVAPPGVISEEFDPAVAAEGGMVTLVVIPADISLPLREESVPARGCLLTRMAELLACPSPHHVLQWGRVGHKASFVADPRVAVARAEALAATAVMDPAGEPPTRLQESPSMPRSVAASFGGVDSTGEGEKETGLPADSESEAASTPAAVTEGHFAPPPPRLRRPAVSGPLPGIGPATPTPSEHSTCLPACTSGEEIGGPILQDFQRSAMETASGSAGGDGGGAISVSVPFMQPPASPGAYRVDSTITLAVQRGPAAMDWEADGQTEVRGPEHLRPPGADSGTEDRGGGGGARSGAGPGAGHGRGTRHHGNRQSGAHHHHGGGHGPTGDGNRFGPGAGAASRLPTLSVKPHGGSGRGNNAACSSPRHANMHPSLTTLPEPSLYSKLLLPALPPTTTHGRRVLDVGVADPPPLASLRNAAAAAGPRGGTGSGSAGVAALPYTLAGELLNARATWLAGRPVYGDAVATTSRQSPTPQVRKSHHVMKWRNYGPADEWRTANAMTPAAAYVRASHAQLLLRGLPIEYRGAAAWVGPPPRQLLDSYVAAHSPPAAVTSLELIVPDVDLPGEGIAELAGTNFLGLPYKVTAGGLEEMRIKMWERGLYGTT